METPSFSDTFCSALDRVRIVLIGTTHPGNIGATARAMKTMGLSRLDLVAPRFPPNHEEALARAAGAVDVLDNVRVSETVAEAVADCRFLIGCSVRLRSISLPIISPRDCATELCTQPPDSECAILFGREDRGLLNSEMQLCHRHLCIPSNSEYGSLNLAMAVQIVCYELRVACEDAVVAVPEEESRREQAATVAELEDFYAHLDELLQEIKYLNPRVPRRLRPRLRRLFGRIVPDHMEVRMLRGIFRAIQNSAGLERDSGSEE